MPPGEIQDPSKSPVNDDAGQSGAARSRITVPDPDVSDGGQAADGTGGTSKGKAPAPDQGKEVFFDPKELDAALDGVPEPVAKQVRALEKQLRGVFTRKTESVSKMKQKVEAYDAFMSDPVGQVRRLAAQYGLSLADSGKAKPEDGDKSWTPESWDEVFDRFQERILKALQGDFAPVLDNVRKLTASNVEQTLNKIDADWRLYEDDMKANLDAHPTLVNDIPKLYRISVPEEVFKKRATQQALRQIEDEVEAAKLHGGKGSASRSEPAPKKAKNFNDAVQIAKEQLKKEGRYR